MGAACNLNRSRSEFAVAVRSAHKFGQKRLGRLDHLCPRLIAIGPGQRACITPALIVQTGAF